MPEEPTQPNHASDAAKLCLAVNRRLWREMKTAQHDCIDALWNNPHATPQQVCDELGTKAVMNFDDHAALTELIVERSIAAGLTPDIKLPTHAFTRNQDGTVTVLDEPYTPPT